MALKTSYKRSMLCHIMSDIATEFKIIAINTQLLAIVSNNSYQTTSNAKIVVNDIITLNPLIESLFGHLLEVFYLSIYFFKSSVCFQF